MTSQQLGQQIRSLRQTAGLTQTEAAKHAGVCHQTWREWERGTVIPRGTRIAALAAALDAPLAAIYDPTVIGEIRLEPATLEALRQGGQPAIDAHVLRLAEALRPALIRATLTHNPPQRTQSAVDRVPPLVVAERLLRSRQASVAIAERQVEALRRAQAVE